MNRYRNLARVADGVGSGWLPAVVLKTIAAVGLSFAMVVPVRAQESYPSPYRIPLERSDVGLNQLLDETRDGQADLMRQVLEALHEGSVRTLEVVQEVYGLDIEDLREAVDRAWQDTRQRVLGPEQNRTVESQSGQHGDQSDMGDGGSSSRVGVYDPYREERARRIEQMAAAYDRWQQEEALRRQDPQAYIRRLIEERRQRYLEQFQAFGVTTPSEPNVPATQAPLDQQVVELPPERASRGGAHPTQQSPGMTQEEFRASVEQSMREFQEAYERIRQEPEAVSAPAGEPTSTEQPAARQPREQIDFDERIVYDENAPESNYDAQGYRQPSEGSGRPSTRQNRVYTTDGQSRPIGRDRDSVTTVRPRPTTRTNTGSGAGSVSNAMRLYSRIVANNNRRYRTRAPARYNSPRVATPTQPYVERPNRVYTADGASQPIGQGPNVVSVRSSTGQPAARQPRAQIDFDEQIVYDENAPENDGVAQRSSRTPESQLPSVERRTPGTRSQTAGLNLGM